jgi:magnesium transporter
MARWATTVIVKGGADVDVRLLGPAGVTEHLVDELTSLLVRDDALVWVDIPTWDDSAARVLAEVFTFHPLAIRDCAQRNQVPKVHVYGDHVFVVLHAPHAGAAGHVHYVELDQFIGPRFLVTVHGPLNPAVDPAAAMIEVNAVLPRLESGRLRPTQAYELSHALVSALTGRLRDYTAVLTQDVWKLEQRVTGGHLGDAEQFLDEMFRARHGLLTVKTMAALSREVYARMAKIRDFGTDLGHALVEDTVDQFDRLRAMADGQKDYLQGTIEFYQARTNTKMTIAAERLAVIAAVTLPVTAISSILGMNVIVNEDTQPVALAIALLVMATISVTLLVWAKRKGWW